MPNNITVLACGSAVNTKSGGGIKATITAVSIRFNKVQYEVSYFWEGDYKTAWLDECEFDVIDPKKKVAGIGFKP